MYCIKCGVKLADTEKQCPLCNTRVYHPDLLIEHKEELYPSNQMPKSESGKAFLGGAIIILLMIPMIITFLSDILPDQKIDWFGYVGGALILFYLSFALPMWFQKPNPVIFVPCDFVACALYLLYIDLAMGGTWFLPFALPITGGAALIVCTLVTLLRYLRKGRLFVIGGSVIALGGLVLMIELLSCVTFQLPFLGWSIYPLISLLLVGGLLIYLAMSSSAREKFERKLFF